MGNITGSQLSVLAICRSITVRSISCIAFNDPCAGGAWGKEAAERKRKDTVPGRQGQRPEYQEAGLGCWMFRGCRGALSAQGTGVLKQPRLCLSLSVPARSNGLLGQLSTGKGMEENKKKKKKRCFINRWYSCIILLLSHYLCCTWFSSTRFPSLAWKMYYYIPKYLLLLRKHSPIARRQCWNKPTPSPACPRPCSSQPAETKPGNRKTKNSSFIVQCFARLYSCNYWHTPHSTHGTEEKTKKYITGCSTTYSI